MSNREGFGRATIHPVYPGVENGVPLLSTFYFRFDKQGTSEAVDNHINAIEVFPASVNTNDLTPGAGIPLETVEPGKITLMYQDHDSGDAKDRYFYKVAHSIRPVSNRRFQIRDVGCVGTCVRVLPRPPGPNEIFVLVGFKVFFIGLRDHHIDEIAVFEENGALTVKLNDKKKNLDDTFAYVVDYALVTPHFQSIHLGEESGVTQGGARVDLSAGVKVIRGFHFDFEKEKTDHHLREIGVLTSNNNLEVFYADRNGDDRFRWRVRWARIGPVEIP